MPTVDNPQFSPQQLEIIEKLDGFTFGYLRRRMEIDAQALRANEV
jgi:hypothetical protein